MLYVLLGSVPLAPSCQLAYQWRVSRPKRVLTFLQDSGWDIYDARRCLYHACGYVGQGPR